MTQDMSKQDYPITQRTLRDGRWLALLLLGCLVLLPSTIAIAAASPPATNNQTIKKPDDAEQSIRFEFYTTLPNMRVPVPAQIKQEQVVKKDKSVPATITPANKAANSKQKSVTASAKPIVKAEEVEQAFSSFMQQQKQQ
ncbi:MAG TPA: hypothetical protein VHZ76_10885 [Gammaproteobacteria bacterium]|jgi:hypothetical protein|nr:hypothetical protein [Gammaproteobacteria bacterium]